MLKNSLNNTVLLVLSFSNLSRLIHTDSMSLLDLPPYWELTSGMGL